MRLHNTMTGKVEEFVPLEAGKVRMYNCGPTVYKRNTVGNFRAYVMADLLRRALEHLGYEVTQVMNITDVGHLTEDDVADAQGEDKLQKEARERNVDPWQIAREAEEWFHEDRKELRIQDAQFYPRATEHIAEMIEIIEGLIGNGHAYAVDGNVYFAVDSFKQYGALSGNTVEKLEAGASGRVDDREDKRNPNDFALWKRDPKHLMKWPSPWGEGYPGWHIECSAMSRKYLGDTFDIHSGGPDNIFPHHECEIAQSESYTGKPFVRHWVHCGWLTIAGDKMSKSKGKVATVPELVTKGYAGADIRTYLLKQHYRTPVPFRIDLLDEAKRIRERFNNFVNHEMAKRPEEGADIDGLVDETKAKLKAALEDDLNTSQFFAVLHDFIGAVNRAGPSRAAAEQAVGLMRAADEVLAILDEAPEGDLDAGIEALVEERQQARKDKDFARADEIRDELAARGIELLDTPQGIRWKRK
ncbi:MAG: cysteine--tRNA ligase [Planctomycetota bacterium]|jgi:cysteinyl-tRNA synthetase